MKYGVGLVTLIYEYRMFPHFAAMRRGGSSDATAIALLDGSRADEKRVALHSQ